MTAVEIPTQVAEFGDLQIQWDERILRPRWWTTAQSYWAADLAATCPDGPILELCCGAGQIGLLAAALTGRPLIQVDRDPVAAAYVRRNAAATGVSSDVREASLGRALAPGEEVALVILDPPWVPTSRVPEFPEDPVGAIDGGVDGTDQLVLGLGVAMRHLLPGGHIVAQVGDYEQVTIVEALLAGLGSRDGARWGIAETRDYSPEGVLIDIMQKDGPTPTDDTDPEDAVGGEVSEVASFDEQRAVEEPGDAVAGHPTDGEVQEGAAGPEAPPRHEPGDPEDQPPRDPR